MKQYILNVLIALDQVFTALIGGWPDETLSSYAWRMERQAKPWGKVTRPMIDGLFGGTHCLDAYIAEQLRRQSPPEER